MRGRSEACEPLRWCGARQTGQVRGGGIVVRTSPLDETGARTLPRDCGPERRRWVRLGRGRCRVLTKRYNFFATTESFGLGTDTRVLYFMKQPQGFVPCWSTVKDKPRSTTNTRSEYLIRGGESDSGEECGRDNTRHAIVQIIRNFSRRQEWAPHSS